MSEEIRVFVGYDSREDIAYRVCKHSILNTTTQYAKVERLVQKDLRKAGIYTREVDQLASTEFTFTRFLIPHLMNFKGWALFVDCDFVFKDDIKKLWDQRDVASPKINNKKHLSPESVFFPNSGEWPQPSALMT